MVPRNRVPVFVYPVVLIVVCVRCPKYNRYKWLNASNGTTRYTYFWFFYMKHIPGTRYTATTQEATEQQVVAVGPRPQDIYSKQQSRFRLVSSPVFEALMHKIVLQ